MDKTLLPKHLPEFKTLTLLFVADTMRAKWYLLNGREMTKLGSIEHSKPAHTDSQSRPNMDEIERNDLEHFGKRLAETIIKETTAVKAKHVILSVPQRIKSQFEKHLTPAFKKKITRQHDANLYRFNGLEVLKLMFK